MSVRTRWAAISGLLAATVLTVLGQQASTASGLELIPSVLRGLSLATDLGPKAPTQPIQLVIALNRPNPAGELEFINAVHNPANPSYRKFLTPSQFAARFGVPATRRAATRSWITVNGMSIVSMSTTGDLITVKGTIAQVSRAFHTQIDNFAYKGVRFYANKTAISVPRTLSIRSVLGLSSLVRTFLPQRPTPIQPQCIAASICIGLQTSPQDLRSIYNTGNLRGVGQKIGIIGAGATDGVINDLRIFEKEYGLPVMPVVVKHPAGQVASTDTSNANEWDLDTQAASSMAPAAQSLTMYMGTSLNDVEVPKLFSRYVNDPAGPQQVSASFGACEGLPTPLPQLSSIGNLPFGLEGTSSYDAVLTAIEQQGVAEGRSIFVSSGDTGSSCPLVVAPILGAGNGLLNQAFPATYSPAALPWSVAVGGTALITDTKGHRRKEWGWAYSGGGSDLWVDAPSYQHGTPGLTLNCITDGKLCRGVPDISAQSGNTLFNTFGIVVSGKDSYGVGTSLSAPLAQGLWADIQSVSKDPRGFGFANFTYYRAGKSASYGSTFFDVGGSSSQTLPSVNGLYATGKGWDYVTGWGTQDVRGLACFVMRSSCGHA